MEITIKSKKKYRTNSKAAKHTYRTRTGPNCCTVNCAAHPPKGGTGIKMSARVARRVASGR